MREHDENLANLSELDHYDLVDQDQDLRGRPLVTTTGERLGIIQRMLVDKRRERVAALVLEDGTAIPVEEIAIKSGKAVIENPGRARPAPPLNPAAGAKEVRVPIVEEELAVGKREVERGHIHVRSRVVETPVHEQVTLQEEHVKVQRRPVNQPIQSQEADSLLKGQEIEITETVQEPVIEKRAVVREEVTIRKDVEERTESVDDSVRRTEVEVDRKPNPNRKPDRKS